MSMTVFVGILAGIMGAAVGVVVLAWLISFFWSRWLP
jgi:hypothetical protein